MTEIDERLRRWTDDVEPVTASEARRRAGGAVVPLDPRRSPRAVLLVAAAALVVLAGLVAFVGGGSNGGSDRLQVGGDPDQTIAGPQETTTEPHDATTEPENLTGTSIVAEVPAGDASPTRFVGLSEDHELVVVDRASGAIVRVLDSFDDPGAEPPPEEPAGFGRYLGAIAVSPDGQTVYYETCCEPAVGTVYRVPVTGGEPELFTYGTHPAVSPDGTRLAVVELQALKVVDLATGAEVRYPPADDDWAMALANPSWSPDGTKVALERYDESIDQGRVVVVTLGEAGDALEAAPTVAEHDGDGTPMFPTFDAEGRVNVVRQSVGDRNWPVGPTRVEVVDALGGGEISRRDLDQPVRSQRHSADGRELLRVLGDGSVRVTSGGETRTVVPAGFQTAAW